MLPQRIPAQQCNSETHVGAAEERAKPGPLRHPHILPVSAWCCRVDRCQAHIQFHLQTVIGTQPKRNSSWQNISTSVAACTLLHTNCGFLHCIHFLSHALLQVKDLSLVPGARVGELDAAAADRQASVPMLLYHCYLSLILPLTCQKQ